MMKLSSTPLFQLLIVSLLSICLSSCGADDDPKVDILKIIQSDDWEVKSFKRNETELLGTEVNDIQIKYKKKNANAVRKFDWTILMADGTTDVVSGNYECNSDADELEHDFKSGDFFSGKHDFDMLLKNNDDEIELASTINGIRYVISAEQ